MPYYHPDVLSVACIGYPLGEIILIHALYVFIMQWAEPYQIGPYL